MFVIIQCRTGYFTMKSTETNNGKKGGLLKGKPHYDKNGKPLGGIKAVVTDSGEQVELS